VRAFSTLCSPVIDKSGQAIFISEETGYRLPLTFHPLTIRATSLPSEDKLPTLDLKAYAHRGAEARIAELTAELNDIYRAFPDLRRGVTRSAAPRAGVGELRRKRKSMSTAEKAEVSKRMKKYWAARRAKKG
jgi:hypothetical protein